MSFSIILSLAIFFSVIFYSLNYIFLNKWGQNIKNHKAFASAYLFTSSIFTFFIYIISQKNILNIFNSLEQNIFIIIVGLSYGLANTQKFKLQKDISPTLFQFLLALSLPITIILSSIVYKENILSTKKIIPMILIMSINLFLFKTHKYKTKISIKETLGFLFFWSIGKIFEKKAIDTSIYAYLFWSWFIPFLTVFALNKIKFKYITEEIKNFGYKKFIFTILLHNIAFILFLFFLNKKNATVSLLSISSVPAIVFSFESIFYKKNKQWIKQKGFLLIILIFSIIYLNKN